MLVVEEILNHTKLFVDIADTPPEDGVEWHKKGEHLKTEISKDNVYLLGEKNNSGHVKRLIKLVTKLSIKHMLNKGRVS